MAFRANFVKNIIHFAAQRGAVLTELLDILDCDALGDLDEEERIFDRHQYEAVVEAAVAQTGDPHIGLHMGECMSLSAAGVIVQIAQNSRTVREALEYTVAFANLGCRELPFHLTELEQSWELSLRPDPEWVRQCPISARQTMDGMMVFTLREFQSITLQKYEPVSVHFSYVQEDAQAEYRRIFQCPVRLDRPGTAMYLQKEHVADRVVGSDYALLQLLVRYAENKLEQTTVDQDFSNRVRKTILHMAHPQFPTIRQAAANLNVSVRTLQRRLKEEGFTYQELIDELKKQFALDYLRHEHLSVREIADSLDFAEASSFIRTFNRWFGVSPQLYREQYLQH